LRSAAALPKGGVTDVPISATAERVRKSRRFTVGILP
jgi:hypothetical protein